MPSELALVNSERDYLPWAFALSISLHLLLFAELATIKPNSQAELPVIVDVSFAPELTTKPKIAPDSERSLDIPENFQARRFASKDSRVEREQLRRGLDPLAGPDTRPRSPGQQSPQAPQTPKTQQAQRTAKQVQKTKAAPKKTQAKKSSPLDLKLKRGRLLDALSDPKAESQTSARTVPLSDLTTSVTTPQNYRAFSRPSGSGARFFGARGSSAYMPDLPDGDITLMNAKANQYATFVRRVALEVFRQLRESGWETLASSEVRRIKAGALVEAIMDLEGELVSLELVEESGSKSFDVVLQRAARKGTRDPNPPASAAIATGNIHFLFRAKSWIVSGGGARSPGERRWLLLSTGLR